MKRRRNQRTTTLVMMIITSTLILIMMKMNTIWKMTVTVGTIHLINCNFYRTIAWNN
ncbi:hypothetical protein ACFX1R_046021 [Malus domestica]